MATARCTVSDAAVGGAAGAVAAVGGVAAGDAAIGGATAGDDYFQSYVSKVLATSPASLIAYWPLSEASGADILDLSGNAYHGTYTGVTLGQTGIGDGRTCPLWDGANDYGNLFSEGFAGAFNGAEGTLAGWFRVYNDAVWTDGTARFGFSLTADVANTIRGYRPAAANNTLRFHYIAGGTNKQVDITSSSVAFLHIALTWSASADQFKVYLAGSQSGSTQTGLGIWAGSLASTTTLLGASTKIPGNPWYGYIAHPAVWTTALTPLLIGNLATV